MVEVLVPLRQPRVKHRGVGDLHRLPVIGRGQRRLFAKAEHQPRTILAKLLGQRHAGLERVEQPPVGQIELHADVNAQRLGRLRASASRTSGPGEPGVGSPSVRSTMPTR